jgi:hypothetical protein
MLSVGHCNHIAYSPKRSQKVVATVIAKIGLKWAMVVIFKAFYCHGEKPWSSG